MNFNDIIQSAENSENDLYFKKKKENYSKIYRRDAKRLQLCCRREPESCSYSIRCNFTNSPNGIVKIQEANHIHSCCLKVLSKPSRQPYKLCPAENGREKRNCRHAILSSSHHPEVLVVVIIININYSILLEFP